MSDSPPHSSSQSVQGGTALKFGLKAYVVGYIFLRSTGAISHVYDEAKGSGHEVLAVHSKFLDTLGGMAKENASPMAGLHQFIEGTWTPLVNGVFWPLRHLEAAFHTLIR